MIDVRQRGMWLRPATAVWIACSSVLFLISVIAIVLTNGGAAWGAAYVAVMLFIFGGLRPLVWWSGTELRIDSSGIFYGSDRPRRQPAQVAYAARNPYQAPWEAVSNVRLVSSRRAVRRMWRKMAQRNGISKQVTAFLGYFPLPGRPALVFDVDPTLVTVPEVVMPKQRLYIDVVEPEHDVPTWAFPVRDVRSVVEAIRGWGIVVTETNEPQPPRPAPRVRSVDEAITDILTKNLGRAPTEAEIRDIRDRMDEDDR